MISVDKKGDLEKLLEVFNRARGGKRIFCYMIGTGEILFYKFENKRNEYGISELKIDHKEIPKKEKIKSFFGDYYPEYLQLMKKLGLEDGCR